MIVASEKLTLRYAVASDPEQLFHYTGNVASSKFLARKAHINPEQTREMLVKLSTSESFKTNGMSVWVICLNETESPIGMLTLVKKGSVIEIHFGLIQKFTGRGFASEALSLASSHCCSSKIANKVVSFTDKENVVAQAVLVNSGFECTGSIENFYIAVHLPGKGRDVYSYLYAGSF